MKYLKEYRVTTEGHRHAEMAVRSLGYGAQGTYRGKVALVLCALPLIFTEGQALQALAPVVGAFDNHDTAQGWWRWLRHRGNKPKPPLVEEVQS